MRDWPPCPPIQRDSGRRSRPGVNPFISALTVARCPATFPGVWPQLRDTLSTSRSVGRGTGAFIYLPPFSENSPIFRSFPFAKIQPVFLPEQTGRMKHRTPFSTPATPAGITHYTLLRKVVCQMGALPPLETPTRKGGTLPLHGAHTAFSCYPALRLYRLSKSPRGIDVVSLTLGNSGFPFADRRSGHAHGARKRLLRYAPFPAQGRNGFTDLPFHSFRPPFLLWRPPAFMIPVRYKTRNGGAFNLWCEFVEWRSSLHAFPQKQIALFPAPAVAF